MLYAQVNIIIIWNYMIYTVTSFNHYEKVEKNYVSQAKRSILSECHIWIEQSGWMTMLVLKYINGLSIMKLISSLQSEDF